MPLPMTRDEAWALFCEWTASESLRRHVLAVEACMRAYAEKFGADADRWGLVGMLHDLDYERYPDLHTGHPRMALAELEHGLGVPDARDVVEHDRLLGQQRAGQQGQRGVLVSGGLHGAGKWHAALDDELLHDLRRLG